MRRRRRGKAVNMGLFSKVFGTRSEREVKKLSPTVDAVMALEDSYRALTDEEKAEISRKLKANGFNITF